VSGARVDLPVAQVPHAERACPLERSRWRNISRWGRPPMQVVGTSSSRPVRAVAARNGGDAFQQPVSLVSGSA